MNINLRTQKSVRSETVLSRLCFFIFPHGKYVRVRKSCQGVQRRDFGVLSHKLEVFIELPTSGLRERRQKVPEVMGDSKKQRLLDTEWWTYELVKTVTAFTEPTQVQARQGPSSERNK